MSKRLASGTLVLAGVVVGRQAAAASPTVVTIDPSQTYQKMVGFGASLTDSGAAAVASLSVAGQATLMRSLFSGGTGAGLSFLRQPMGASDFRTADYTYDDVPVGQTDYNLSGFSIAHDTTAYAGPGGATSLVSLVRQAQTINPGLSVMGTPWTAPGWMKTAAATNVEPQPGVDQRLYGGTLTAGSATVQAYANYFVKYVQAYAAQGIKVSYVTPQNEPFYDGGFAYPAMTLTAAQQATLIQAIGGAFATALVHPALPYNATTNPHVGDQVKIEALDHNWSDAVSGTAPSANITTLLNDPATAKYVDGIAFHGYSGAVSAQTIVHNAYPTKNVFFTEQTGTVGSDFASDLMYDAKNLIVGGTRNYASALVKFNLALDQNSGPKIETVTFDNGTGSTTTADSGFDSARGVVTVNTTTGGITYNEEFYALGQIAKFVDPGAVRIGSDSDHSVAFLNPDGTTALVAYNDATTPVTDQFSEGGRSFSFTLPTQSLVTFSWSAGSAVEVYETTGDQTELLARQADVTFAPEPTSLALAGLAAGPALLGRRRSRRPAKAS